MTERIKNGIGVRIGGFVLWLFGGLSFAHSLFKYLRGAEVGNETWNKIYGFATFGFGGVFAIGMAGFIVAITGKTLPELNAYWIAIDPYPFKKCILSILVFIVGILALMAPIMMYGFFLELIGVKI
jgi:hypothetical protein